MADDSVVSPYDAGLSYYMDEYTAAVEKGPPFAWRGMMVSEGLGYPLVRAPREDTVPMNWRGMMTSEGFGNVPPSNVAISNDASGQDTSTLQSVISFAKTVWQNWTAGAARDATRENRANLIMDFAIAGSVLGAQICLAGPANVASHEDPYWDAAQKAIQAARPDVWAEAEQAGGWWPVGEPGFDMLKERQQMAAALSSVGITVNQAAISAPFTTTPTPFQVTVAPGVAPPPQPGQSAPPVQPGQSLPPVAGGGPPPATTPLLAGGSSSLAVLALLGAVAYAATRKRA